ncbi:polynucleotide adenylyltransferase PcnB [Orrella marina]|uniref:Poly(A) polymerase I n=1 Tax=Orrella marina TaxID=2163011 RepID=A0A2R4XNB8_9BURK|nr:polynucleotide adenylyltransferase PcnB [Orrella marina]AWB35285.1 polynucleotide adenylyltransferase PcnB [Orrella marina]
MITETIKGFVKRLIKPGNKSPGPVGAGKAKRYSRDEHQIDRRLVSRHAVKVCEVLQQAGFEAFLVGGAVRDLMVGLEPKDFDVATNATPDQVRPLFRRARIIGKRFQLVHVVFGQEIIETSTFRAPAAADELTDDHGRILRDNVFGTQKQDAARRDFTINALYYDPVTETVVDFHDGVRDLKARAIRMIGEPASRYREDPVRMLRAVRFAVKLRGEIEPATAAPIGELAELIENVPSSRVFDEMYKLLTCGHAMDCLKQLRSHGLHSGLLPLLDMVLEEPDGLSFIELALERTDKRVRGGKSVSPSFLFASLLWPQVRTRWQRLYQAGEHSVPALIAAADDVMNAQGEKLAINRRFSSDMREIWFMQPRFERRQARTAFRMSEQPRFRAAVDFLQLRAACSEFDSVLAQWWMDFADAPDAEKARMADALSGKRQPGSSETEPGRPRKRPRRRRKTSAGAAAAAGRSSASTGNSGAPD